ncbi:hypothetical protein AAMO2058_000439000 [Amorphochlora amoebiformis]|uniref:Isochorismatase-like domain-containing protein n=1 Tax=Amorphochlora amoebiformis TaxID=1561963 RepID=A0A7S0DT36_9EUKA|mmetsp:Transcript_5563/g.8491  ORF Transcript_5563/g.8491 Transcript_5563/m.8491 type:complete len:201 (+) Transcript_5563:83-685(+)
MVSKGPKLLIQKTGILCCDIQEVFRKHISYMPSVIHCSKWILQAGNELKMPIIYTEQAPKKLGGTVTELEEELKGAKRFEKTKFSMLTEEVVNSISDLPDYNTWVLVGIESHVCVQQTCLGLRDLGHDVFVLADAVSSQKQGDRFTALQRMRQAGAVVTTTESAIFELLGDFQHPSAKKLSQRASDRPDSGLATENKTNF